MTEPIIGIAAGKSLKSAKENQMQTVMMATASLRESRKQEG